MQLFAGVLAFAIFVAPPAAAFAQEAPRETEAKVEEGDQSEAAKEKDASPSFWMERKLNLSKSLLDGLVAGDSEKIIAAAKAMKRLNRIEAFTRRPTAGYVDLLRNFENAVDEIAKQAEKENLEGAALGFTKLTFSCVDCHKKLRAPE